MLVVLSPAKTLDFSPTPVEAYTVPEAHDQTEILVRKLRGFSQAKLGKLMKLSDKLAKLNTERYAEFEVPASGKNSKQAIFAFKGDTYRDMPLDSFSDEDFAYAQKHIRILSGLYGTLRPLDMIQPYRLEMGTRLSTRRGKDLYAFWGKRITDALNAQLEETGDDILVNCASNEYFKSVQTDRLKARVIDPVFKDYKSGKYKVISFYAKRVRGLMASWIVQERVEDLERLKTFTGSGYAYDPERSTEDSPVFLRRES